MTAVPELPLNQPLPLPLHALVTARRSLPYAAVLIGLLLIPVTLPLAAATLVLGLVELFFRRFARAWAALSSDPSVSDFDVVGPAMRTETSGLVALQGVVLGLVFSFISGAAVSPTVRVAAVALVVGVLLGLLLLSLIAFGIDDARQGRIAAQVFILSLNAAAYGLLCIGAATVFER